MVIFKSKQKKFEGDLKIKLCGKRLYPTESAKYLGVKIDTNLSWQDHVNDLSIKLNRANALLFKMRKYVSLKTLRFVVCRRFEPHPSIDNAPTWPSHPFYIFSKLPILTRLFRQYCPSEIQK